MLHWVLAFETSMAYGFHDIHLPARNPQQGEICKCFAKKFL